MHLCECLCIIPMHSQMCCMFIMYVITAGPAWQSLGIGWHCVRKEGVIPDCVGADKFQKVFFFSASSVGWNETGKPFLVTCFSFLFFPFRFPCSVSTPSSLLPWLLPLMSVWSLDIQTHHSIPPFMSLLSEHTTFPLYALSPRTRFFYFFFFFRSYSAESFPLETVRGRLVLYQCVCVCSCVCVFGGGGPGERIS